MTETLPEASEENQNRKRADEYVRKLRYNSPAPQGRSELGSPRGATSVRRTPVIDEEHRRERLTPVREKWERKATGYNATIARTAYDDPAMVKLRSRRKYAVDRVARLNSNIGPRLEQCGQESLPVVCGCGPVGAKKTCRQWWLCASCRVRRSPQLGADIRKGLEVALAEETAAWGREGGRGMAPAIRLITLTAAHTGDLVHDHAVIAEGWRKLYKRMNEDDEKFPYVGVWEVTPGTDGLGHVHLHLAVVWRYRDFWRIRAQWETACPSSRYLDIKERKDKKASSPASVGKYLGKYLSKGADVNGFNATLRAEVSAAFYNQRSVISSLGFKQKKYKACCRKCGMGFRLESDAERREREAGDGCTVVRWLSEPSRIAHHEQLEWMFDTPEVTAGLH